MSTGIFLPVFEFLCGSIIGAGGIGIFIYLAYCLVCRRDELLQQNEIEGITPRFEYDPYTQMGSFEMNPMFPGKE